MGFLSIVTAVVSITLISLCAAARYSSCQTEPTCSIQPVLKMKGADCYDRGLKFFPRCLPSDVEVIHATYNRIRKISNTELTRYSDLAFLYLNDNLIFNLEDDAFLNMDELICLDLSENALAKVPKSTFQLPSLQKLFLSQNRNINIIDSIENAKPITSPLGFLNLSLTTDDDNIYEFPNFGPMPFLKELDVSGNQYSGMNPKSFVGMCRLEILHADNVTVEYDDDCQCWSINFWLIEHNVQFKLLPCKVNQEECSLIRIPDEDLEDWHTCNQLNTHYQEQQRNRKIVIGISSLAAVVIMILVLYFYKFYYKRNDTIVKHEGNSLLKSTQKSIENDYV